MLRLAADLLGDLEMWASGCCLKPNWLWNHMESYIFGLVLVLVLVPAWYQHQYQYQYKYQYQYQYQYQY